LTWVNAAAGGRRDRDAMSDRTTPSRCEPEPMGSVDRAWLEMDTPDNPMVVTSILEFEDVADAAVLARALIDKTLRERRFRQRVAVTDEGTCWIEDDDLRLGYHIQTQELRDTEGDRALRNAIAAELAHPLDRALPLWRIALFLRGAGRVTALFRAHHAIADGVAMMHLMLALDDGAPARAATPLPRVERHHGPLGGLIDRIESVNVTLENLTGLVIDDLRHPRKLRSQLADARRTLAAVGRVVALRDDNPRRLRGKLRGRRAVAWTSNLSLATVRQLAHAQGVTLNDVFLTALAGAFGRYLRAHDAALPEQQNLRVAVPVNLRAAGDDSLGNSFGLVLVDLPVGLEGCHARLDVIADRMASLKRSSEARAVLVALAAVGRLPVTLEKRLVGLISGKSAAVVSNLPGPREALTVGGARLANVVFWPPQSGGIGIGVSLLSYAGHVTVGISSDVGLIEKPQEIVDAFCAELEAMLGHSPAVRPGAAHRRLHGLKAMNELASPVLIG
jgi:diacylglycerol O-acyltransferase / wax synthase